jgi:uncharacterized protein (TIGR03382 family)
LIFNENPGSKFHFSARSTNPPGVSAGSPFLLFSLVVLFLRRRKFIREEVGI